MATTTSKKKTKKAPRSAGKTKAAALTLLEKDHREVDALFKRYESGRGASRADTLREICNALSAHAALEEELFYPALRSALAEEGQDLLDEAHVEHASIKALVAELELAEPGEEMVDAKVKVLSEYVKHHVEEEEDEIFPRATKAKALDLEQLAEQMTERKAELERDPVAVRKSGRRAAASARH